MILLVLLVWAVTQMSWPWVAALVIAALIDAKNFERAREAARVLDAKTNPETDR